MDKLLYTLNDYMFFDFNDENLHTLEKNKTPPLEEETSKKNLFFPNQKDKLFWCYFILRYGFDSYNSIKDHHFKIEKKEKESYIRLLEENKTKIKQRKIKYDVNDLLYQPRMSLEMFFSLCCASEINVVYVKSKTFFTLKDNSITKVNYICEDKKMGFGIMLKQNEELNKTHLESVSLTKNLKGISSYRLDDIKKMCHILNIKTISVLGKPITKIELYNKIIRCIE